MAAATVSYRRTAAGRRRRRVLPHSSSPAAAARVDRHPARRHGGSSRRAVVSQRPAAFEIAGRAARIVRPDSRRIATLARDRRSLYVFAGRTALRVSPGTGPAGVDAAGIPEAAHLARRPAALSRRRAGESSAAAQTRTAADRRVAVRGVFPDGLGPGPIRPRARFSAKAAGRRRIQPSATAWALPP